MHGQRTESRRGRLALQPCRFRVSPRKFSVAFQRLAHVFWRIGVGLWRFSGVFWRLRASGKGVPNRPHRTDLHKEFSFINIKNRPLHEICITVETSDRFVGAFASLLVRAAGQTQEGSARQRTPGRKHRLNDTGDDQRHPQDQSGTLEERRGGAVSRTLGVVT